MYNVGESGQVAREGYLWQLGEQLFLTGEAETESKQEQESHRESNAKEGVIREFIERPIPAGWDKRSLSERRLYWSGEFGRNTVDCMARDRVCALEVWCECLNGDLKFMKQVDSREINSILASIQGWKRHNSTFRFGYCGIQRGFIKL